MAAISRAQGHSFLRLVAAQIRKRQQAFVSLHICGDKSRRLAFVKFTRAAAL
jgi:hypothetical protein